MDVSALSSLLQESKIHEESRLSSQQPPITGSTVKIVLPNQNKQENTKISNTTKIIEDKSIWNLDELPTEDTVVCDVKDNRPCPRYEFAYKQIVGTEDVFLGMSDKSPSSSDCTHLVVKIHFPNSSMKELDVDITKRRIKAESRTHKLFTYLPVNVDESNGVAKFDSKSEVLSVILPIIQDSI